MNRTSQALLLDRRISCDVNLISMPFYGGGHDAQDSIYPARATVMKSW